MKKLLCIFLILIFMLLSGCMPPTPKEVYLSENADGLTVHFIDVGQGDSTLLESNGEFVLVDAGERDYGETVLDYIRSRGAERLKYLIATHPHSDHYGGIRNVVDSIETENFITVETDCTTISWTKTLARIDALGINYIDAVPGDTYDFGNAHFTILAPLSGGYEGYNDYSVVIKAAQGDISFLLTGDAERTSEDEMLEAGYDLSADVLKCGHHGSSDATSTRFLKAVNPEYAVVSCGKANEYGHPHRETRARLSLLNCVLRRTDTEGTLVACTDGHQLYFRGDEKAYIAGEKHTTPDALAYIGNRNSLIFHDPTCEGGQSMKEKNKVILATREDAIAQGFTPCPHCNP